MIFVVLVKKIQLHKNNNSTTGNKNFSFSYHNFRVTRTNFLAARTKISGYPDRNFQLPGKNFPLPGPKFSTARATIPNCQDNYTLTSPPTGFELKTSYVITTRSYHHTIGELLCDKVKYFLLLIKADIKNLDF